MNNSSMGDRIKYHRKRLGLTQEQLAERIGVSAQAVSKWENNISCPDISVLPELADLFGITVDELLGKTAAAKEGVVVENDQPDKKVTWDFGLNRGGLLFALYILTVGTLLLLRGIVPAMDIEWWTILWTTGLIYIGVSGLFGGFSLFCLVMSLGGVYFLLNAYNAMPVVLTWKYVLPLLVILWGLSLLFDVFVGKKRQKMKLKEKFHKKGDKQHREYHCDNGYLRCDLSFGGSRTAVVTPLLRGGSIETSFGDFTIDFSACEALAPDCTVAVDNSFGTLTLLVPDKFEVVLTENSSFTSASEIQGSPSDNVQGTLHIHADVSFGSMQIRYI